MSAYFLSIFLFLIYISCLPCSFWQWEGEQSHRKGKNVLGMRNRNFITGFCLPMMFVWTHKKKKRHQLFQQTAQNSMCKFDIFNEAPSTEWLSEEKWKISLNSSSNSNKSEVGRWRRETSILAPEEPAGLSAESGSADSQIEDSWLSRCTLNMSHMPPLPLRPVSLRWCHSCCPSRLPTSPLSNEPVAAGQSGTTALPDRFHCSIHHTVQMHTGGPVAHWPADVGIYICIPCLLSPGHKADAVPRHHL